MFICLFFLDNTPDMYDDNPKKEDIDNEIIAIIIGTLIALLLLFAIILALLVRRHRQQKYASAHRLKAMHHEHVTLNLNDLRLPEVTTMMDNAINNGKVSNGNMYNGVAQSDYSNGNVITPQQDVASLQYAVPNNGRPCNGEIYHNNDTMQGRSLPAIPCRSEGKIIVVIVCLLCHHT